jgi:hypothetical protein
MIRNFFEMPRWLKLLTLGGFAALVMALFKPLSGVGVFGERVDPSIWWRSGAGVAFVLPAFVMGLSAVLFLRRSQYGRAVHIAGWIAMTVGAYIGVHLEHINPEMLIPGLAFNLGLTVCIALYLYLSKGVKLYFAGRLGAHLKYSCSLTMRRPLLASVMS